MEGEIIIPEAEAPWYHALCTDIMILTMHGTRIE
jgi:hypothetical protein